MWWRSPAVSGFIRYIESRMEWYLQIEQNDNAFLYVLIAVQPGEQEDARKDAWHAVIYRIRGRSALAVPQKARIAYNSVVV